MPSITLKEKKLYPYIYISDDNQVNFTLPLTNVITDEETRVTITADNTCQTAAAFQTALIEGEILKSIEQYIEDLKIDQTILHALYVEIQHSPNQDQQDNQKINNLLLTKKASRSLSKKFE